MKAQLTQEAKDALIKEFNRLSTYSAGENNRRIWMPDAISIIESFPTSDECRWIPCSERLPEEGQIVLIYERMFVHDATFRNGTFFFGEFDNEPDVSHWQPLPNPPNKRSE